MLRRGPAHGDEVAGHLPGMLGLSHFGVREVAARLNVAEATARRYLVRMERERSPNVFRIGRALRISERGLSEYTKDPTERDVSVCDELRLAMAELAAKYLELRRRVDELSTAVHSSEQRRSVVTGLQFLKD